MLTRVFVAAAALFLVVYHVFQTKRPGLRELRFSDVNFLHTTDTHGWLGGHRNQPAYNGDWGDYVAFAQHLRRLAHDRNQDLLLVDLGDRHDGNGLLDATSPAGKVSDPIFEAQHYDIITLGNHELYQWESSVQELQELIPHYRSHYVCLNVEVLLNGLYVPMGQKFRYFSTPVQKLRVLSFAFLFDFNRANKHTRVTPIESAVYEEWFVEVLEKYGPADVDLIVVVGHIPIAREWAELGVLHRTLRKRYPDTIIQYFGGHSHIRDFSVLDHALTGLQSGRFCETLGFLSINLSKTALRDRFFRAYLDFNTESFGFHAGNRALTRAGTAVKQEIRDARARLGLDRVVGHVSSSYYMDYVPINHPHNIYNMLTEQVLPTLSPTNTSFASLTQRIIIINTGLVRYDLYKGPYTIDTHYIVSPFQNDWVLMKVPKKTAIKIALTLNSHGYIAESAHKDGTASVINSLKPPHQYSLGVHSIFSSALQWLTLSLPQGPLGDSGVSRVLSLMFLPRLRKGYVTHDDFGSDGDDTPHKGVVNYPIPNVVLSLELVEGDDTPVDVVFYSFLVSSVTWALEELGAEVPELEFYLDNFLGQLLSQYVSSGKL